MKKAYWIDGRLLTERDLQDIRAQLEGFKSITAISDEMRDVIETEWPDLAAKLLPPKDGWGGRMELRWVLLALAVDRCAGRAPALARIALVQERGAAKTEAIYREQPLRASCDGRLALGLHFIEITQSDLQVIEKRHRFLAQFMKFGDFDARFSVYTSGGIKQRGCA